MENLRFYFDEMQREREREFETLIQVRIQKTNIQ